MIASRARSDPIPLPLGSIPGPASVLLFESMNQRVSSTGVKGSVLDIDMYIVKGSVLDIDMYIAQSHSPDMARKLYRKGVSS